MKERLVSEKLKEIANHSFIYGLGSVIQSALAILLVPLYTRQFSIDEYGVFSVCIILGTLMGNFFSMGISSSLARSYFDEDSEVHRARVIGTSTVLAMLCLMLQIIFGYLVSPLASSLLFKSSDFSDHILLILTWSSLANFNNIFFVILRFKKMSKQVITINFISLLSSVLIIYSLVVFLNLSIKGALIGMCLNQVILSALLGLVLRKSLTKKFSILEAKGQISFGIPIAFTSVSYFLMVSMDRFVINEYLTSKDVGLYSLAIVIGSAINILFVMPFGQIWSPMRMQYRHDKNANQFYRTVLTYYFLIGFSIIVPISTFSSEIILVIAGSAEYSEAWKVVPLAMVSYLVLGCMNIIDNGLYFARKVKYHAYVYFAGFLINFMANVYLIPKYGFIFGAINLLVTFVIVITTIALISNIIMALQYERARLLKIAISSWFALFFVSALMSVEIGFYPLLLLKFLLSILFLGYTFYFILSKSEREYLSSRFISYVT